MHHSVTVLDTNHIVYYISIVLINLNLCSIYLQKNEKTIKMKFFKVFFLLAIVLVLLSGQSEAGWLKKIGKRIVS